MHKKTLKILGILFSVTLIVLFTVCLVESNSRDVDYFRFGYIEERLPQEKQYIYAIVEGDGVEKQYVETDSLTYAADLYSAQRLEEINSQINFLIDIIFSLGIIVGVGLFILSVCIKPDKKAKKEKAVTVQAPPTPVAVQAPPQPVVPSYSQQTPPQPAPAYPQQNEFCTNCGAVIPAGQGFCTNCGFIQN